ncbi:hypothetical protein CHLNCDRAFT_142301 [Chlorella variabilis]|uniref:Metallo-beta-lactamase domain-containing protein n=1 Tax=Chlorella variabilis TaxID=554065 RepID=E1Z889_CHLVA|nr:hypothetical protein CHLNCDRAFT_142301 [Chlorella variabilis]EFN58303.1 hypothetical protein CHLNCDRAFT_142301 [Chlorella variabilis]|eukprot:XP_005850405.1 hypothetical protein CHLNCDRAFT_142301 [Chlorella variabilis]
MVSTDRSKLVAVASLVPAVLLGLLLFWQWRSTACTFVEAAPGLRLCHQHLLGYQPETALIRVQSREGVWPWRRAVDHWVLVDAGVRDSLLFGSHASSLLKAVRHALRPARPGEAPGQLDLILLTHAHAIGALPKLLQAYPDAKVAAHAEELPFLVGHPPQPLVDNKTQVLLSARAMIAAGLFPIAEQQQGVPAERAVALHGEGGDLADAAKAAGAAAKRALRWLPRGVLSGTLLAGDAVAPTKGWLGWGDGLTVSPYASTTPAALQAAAKALIMQEGRSWSWLLPLHGGNFSRLRAQELVGSWPDEVPPVVDAPQAAADAGAGGPPPHAQERAASHDTAAAGLGLSPGNGGGGGGSFSLDTDGGGGGARGPDL